MVRCAELPEAAKRATADVVPALEARQAAPVRGLAPAPVAAIALTLLAVFFIGVGAGRWLWPRQVVLTQIIKVPEVRERIVEVEVPVVTDHVVVKRVPVIKTRIVYRDRATAAVNKR